MPPSTTQARSPADRLGLDDPSRFRTIRHVAIFDAHEPIPKSVKDPAEVSEDNPDGLVVRELEVTAADLAVIAANTNRRAVAGDPPSLQFGHTPFDDRPEAFHPRHVGFVDNLEVGEVEGRPPVFADLHYIAGLYDEAMSYPRLSVERIGWDDPATHAIDAVALIRRKPERFLAAVPYGSAPISRVCYSRDLPAPGGADPGRRGYRKLDEAGLASIERYRARNNLSPQAAFRSYLAGKIT